MKRMEGSLPERLFLCGFMGAGKTTLGRTLAEKLAVSFYDLDVIIEEKSDRTIRDIFREDGEAAFRRKEREAILSLIRHKKGVIALGGGSLQNQFLLDHIKVNGLLIFIDPPFPVLLERIMQNRNRPLLLDRKGRLKAKDELETELKDLLDERRPLYEQAEVRIRPAGDASNAEVAEQLLKKIDYHVASY